MNPACVIDSSLLNRGGQKCGGQNDYEVLGL